MVSKCYKVIGAGSRDSVLVIVYALKEAKSNKQDSLQKLPFTQSYYKRLRYTNS